MEFRTLIFISLVACTSTVSCADEEVPTSCSSNEEVQCVYGCPPEVTCDNRYIAVLCSLDPNTPCTNKCVCKGDYARNSSGVCIPEDQCDDFIECSPNEEHSNCKNALCRAQDCSQKYEPPGCPSVSQCQKGCVCKSGFLRLDNGTCVEEDQCPNSYECPPNEEYSNCRNGLCRAMDCSQKGLPVACPSIAMCETGCVCKYGFLRLENGTCVAEEECPISNECSINEEYSHCISAPCRALDCSQKGIDPPCELVSECETGCICKYGYLKHENGTCVLEDQCPDTGLEPQLDLEPECGDNEYLDKCPVACTKDYCPQSAEDNEECPTPVICPPPACKCISDYRRADNGTCIPSKDCPDVCPQNEQYSVCTQVICRNEHCSNRNDSVACVSIDPTYCIKGCVCKGNYYRNKNGQCVAEDECDS